MNDFLNAWQYWEITDPPSSVAVKSRVDCLLLEGCAVTEHELAWAHVKSDGLCYQAGWSRGLFWLWKPRLGESNSREDPGLSTNLERQVPLLQIDAQGWYTGKALILSCSGPSWLRHSSRREEVYVHYHDIWWWYVHGQWAVCWSPKLHCSEDSRVVEYLSLSQLEYLEKAGKCLSAWACPEWNKPNFKMETFQIQKLFGLTFDVVLLCERESKMSLFRGQIF